MGALRGLSDPTGSPNAAGLTSGFDMSPGVARPLWPGRAVRPYSPGRVLKGFGLPGVVPTCYSAFLRLPLPTHSLLSGVGSRRCHTGMVVGIIRRLVGGRPGWGSVEESLDPLAGVPDQAEAALDEIIAKLRVAKEELEALKYKITEEVNAYYQAYLEAKRRNNRDEMELAAAEIVVKKKILKAVIAYIKLLNAAIARINDARDVGTASKIMLSLEPAFRMLHQYLVQESPEAAARLMQVVNYAESAVSSVGTVVESMPTARVPLLADPEVGKFLAETFREANVEAEMITPKIEPAKPAIDYEALEKRLLEYIKANGGVLRVREAAARLGVPPSAVKEALIRLQRKGVIRIHSGGPEATPA